MTKEELEKATGQELIDARNYCGVDGYYGDYLENVNAEMLKRFNRLAELERENVKLQGLVSQYKASKCSGISLANRNMIMSDQLVKAKEIITELLKNTDTEAVEMIKEAKQFLSEV